MGISLRLLGEKLKHHPSKIEIKHEDMAIIEHVKRLETAINDFAPTTLYVTEATRSFIDLSNMGKGNLLLTSKIPIPELMVENTNLNILFISANSALDIFIELIDIFMEQQKLTNGSSLFLDALLQGKGIQPIVEAGYKVIGNPLYVRDLNFNCLGFSPNVSVEDPIWKELTEIGYQNFKFLNYMMKSDDSDPITSSIKRLIKQDHLEAFSSTKLPIYLKYCIRDNDDDPPDAESEIETEMEKEYTPNHLVIFKQKYSKNVLSRALSNIWAGDKLVGLVIVLEAFKSFDENDFLLIRHLSDIIALELQKHQCFSNSLEDQQQLFLIDLLDGKITNQAQMNERLKFMGWHSTPPMYVVTITKHRSSISNMPFEYIRELLKNLFESVCVLYKEGVVVLINNSHTRFREILKKLAETLEPMNIACGISRPFDNLFDTAKYYRQSMLALQSGLRMNHKRGMFYYDDYLMQHLFNACSCQGELIEFCHPSLFKLIDYDQQYRTDYIKSLYIYIMKFKNKPELVNSMHVHRNTLYYRIRKIEEIMNLDLNNLEDFFAIYLSFKILEFLGEDSFK